MITGRQRDFQFATGFVDRMAMSAITILPETKVHWRPIADLGAPLGRAEADVGMIVVGSGITETTLLVVEREGSAPGNERNLLKWYKALQLQKRIILRSDHVDQNLPWTKLLVVLAFGRSGGWAKSDFQKTMGFCTDLARIFNEQAKLDDYNGEFRVLGHSGVVNDYVREGAWHAEQLLSSL